MALLTPAGQFSGGRDPSPVTRRLTDKILIAFHQACDQSDFEVAEELLHVLEMMVRRPPPPEGSGAIWQAWWPRTNGFGSCAIRIIPTEEFKRVIAEKTR
jgi:hypothetical protein